METEAGLRRCDCERGKALRALASSPKPKARPPVLDEGAATMFAEMLAGIAFYPSESGARALIGSEIVAMCSSDSEARWLVTQMHRRHGAKWPGVTEMRALFCTYAPPRDGVMAISNSTEAYLEDEYISTLQIAAPDRKQLAAGETHISAAPSLRDFVNAAVQHKDLNRTISNAPKPAIPEIPAVRLTEANRITTSDIERAVQELRTKKAASEVGIDTGQTHNRKATA